MVCQKNTMSQRSLQWSWHLKLPRVACRGALTTRVGSGTYPGRPIGGKGASNREPAEGGQKMCLVLGGLGGGILQKKEI